MGTDGDAALAGRLHRLVMDLLGWLDDYPADEVDPKASASIRQSIAWVIDRLPAEQRDRWATGDPDPASLETVVGLLVDVVWWLDACDDDEVELDVAVTILESGAAEILALPEEQRRRLLDVLHRLAAAEQHDGRRYELRRFPFETGLVDDEPGDEPGCEPDDGGPAVRAWVPPESRNTGSIPAQ